MNIKPLKDSSAVIHKAYKILPDELYKDFVKAISELENNDYHIKQKFPTIRLHKVEGTPLKIFRADINKTSGWRIHLQYDNGFVKLCDILERKEHDRVDKTIKNRKNKYK